MPYRESMPNEDQPAETGSEFGMQNYDPQGKYSLGAKVLHMLGRELEKGVDFGYDVQDEGNEFAELEYGDTKLPPSTILEKQPGDSMRRARQLGKRVLTTV